MKVYIFISIIWVECLPKLILLMPILEDQIYSDYFFNSYPSPKS